jgi:hypothetical protein
MNYTGKLYGKGHGKTYFPLVLTSEDVDRMEKEHAEMKSALEYIAHSGLSARHLEDHAREVLNRQNVPAMASADEKTTPKETTL